ncbi:MAG: methyltransferase domain-containing protein [Rikenellaceae bacterium]
MTELEQLCSEAVRRDVERNIECDPVDVALDKSLCNSRLVATQVKYLQRARTKLPSYYAARCIIPGRAFEQSSSEAAATAKQLGGGSVLDLTCGLGVDAWALSQRFARVVTLERDETLVAVARENFGRLGVTNVEVVHSSAEEYLARCEERFDWIYVDPDRRGADGSKRVVLEDCSPNIVALWGDLQRVSDNVAIKCSPMFDCDEAFRLFDGCSVEVVSVGDECKEVVIYASTVGRHSDRIGATSVGRGSVWLSREEARVGSRPSEFSPTKYSKLVVPDVALQKCRIVGEVLGAVCDVWSDNGYGFTTEEQLAAYDSQRHLCRIFAVEAIVEYEPRRLRRLLAQMGVVRAQILKRDFPYSVAQILKQLKLREGGVQQLAFTSVGGREWMVILENSKK